MINLLLIDDEKTILHGIANLVDWSNHGFQIKGAFSNSLEALDFFSIHSNDIDIVITDLIMPELDGIELARLLKKSKPDIQILVLSSHDEFQLVKDSFKEGVSDYLLKPKLNPENLLSALNHLVKKGQKNLDSKFSLDSSLTQYFSGQKTTISNDPFRFPLFYIVYSEMDDLAPLASLKSNEERAEPWIDCQPFTTLDYEYGCLLNVSSMDCFEQIQTSLREYAQKSDALLIISPCLELSELFDCFQRLKKLGKGQRFYQKSAGVVSEEQLVPLIPHFDQSTKSYLTKIVNKDYVSAIREMKSAIETLIALKIDPLFLKHETINRLYALINALEDGQGTKELTTLKITLPTLITNVATIEDFSITFTKIITQLMRWSTPEKNENSEILTAIYDYVQENYHQDISLQIISEKFHFSYSYLSTMFTEKYGISFTKYLKKVRIQHAKRLLLETTEPLSQISYQVGFAELGYFSRVFKEETGLNPSQYRKGSLKHEEKIQRV
ncbi:helix-turn-helix domain-containing protein [Enterococcus hirae]|uniref:response regulator transcription factor n=1 Tax=Enterococcus hirae TaxID=1354 RepID=UPI0015972E06|nr:helix-turn-helix domain-containing protein [Enterococcus hirae]QKX66345.1 helix-turn-helix domain-containing protein [Enterococcus hirae]